MKKELKGVIVPVITPVLAGDMVDEASFRKVIRFLIGAGIQTIFCGGSAGEGPLLTTKEWVRMVQIAHEECKGKVSLLGGAIETSAARLAERIKILTDVGYENIVVTPSFYITTKSSEEHLRHFGAAREACGKSEMIAYNIPGCTSSEIAVETMCEMARRGWITYCKESSGNIPYFKRLVAAGKDVGLKAFMGDEAGIAEGLRAGACGIVPVCANYEPATFLAAYAAGARGDDAALTRSMERIMYVRERLCLGGISWVAGVKYAVASLGMGSGVPVSPLEPAGAEQKKAIDDLAKSAHA